MNAIAEQEVKETVVFSGDVYSGMCATCQDRTVCLFRKRMDSKVVCCEEYVPEVNQ